MKHALHTLTVLLAITGCGKVIEDQPVDADVPVSDGELCQPTTETCNEVDDDCDGSTDEGFDLQTDPLNCGTCGTQCNVVQQCSGTCVPIGPILFDQSHTNFTAYQTFQSQLTAAGYSVQLNTTTPIMDATLANVSVFVLPIISSSTAYTVGELTAIEHAVEGGMGLLLITDITAHHVQADPVAARFGLSFGGDIGINNMTVAQHPIATGVAQVVRDPSAASIVIDSNSLPILSSSGAFLTATPDGGPETLEGRVVIVTDANMFADFFSGTGNPMQSGDNAVLAGNVIAWLTGHL